MHRFPNEPVARRGRAALGHPRLYREVLAGLALAVAAEPEPVGIGVDSWAVDYALLRDGALLGTPYHYRDEPHRRASRPVHAVVSATRSSTPATACSSCRSTPSTS